MTHIISMMTLASVTVPEPGVCHYGRGDLVNGGGVVCRDSRSPVNVGEHKTMATVEIDANSLARLYDMAKDNYHRNQEAVSDAELDKSVERDLLMMLNRQQDALNNAHEVIEEQSELSVDP
jgi:aromatic ring hydroxylase